MAKKHKPTAAQKARYYKLIKKGYVRLRNVLKRHDPGFIAKTP